jgi:hypothetical protein
MRLNNIAVSATANTSGSATALQIAGGSTSIGGFGCNFTAVAAGGTARAIHVDSGTLTLEGGEITGNIFADTGTTIELRGVKWHSGAFSGSGTLRGDYYDSNGTHIYFDGTEIDSTGNAVEITDGTQLAADDVTLRVLNTSGATASANTIGYILHTAGSGLEFKFSVGVAVAALAQPAVVVVGGANNATIKVATRGRFTLTYTGSAPAAGDPLTFSGTAGAVVILSPMSPNIIAVAMAAGSGGSVDAVLVGRREPLYITDTQFMYGVTGSGDSNFISTIATLPGGAVLTYGAVSSGAANSIVPWAALGTFNAFQVLHNTTRGTSALISSVVTGTSTITLTANVPAGWQVGDTISARSQTNTQNWAGGSYYRDFDLSQMTNLPSLAVGIVLQSSISDTSTAAAALSSFHPYEAFASSKNKQFWSQAGNAASTRELNEVVVDLIDKKFCLGWDATGSNTCTVFGNLAGWIIAKP